MTWWKSLQFTPELSKKMQQVFAQGRVIKTESMKIGAPQTALAPNIPWIFIKPAHQPHCDVWNSVYWQIFKQIPRFCREHCHKVVAKPRNIDELFRLWELMDALGFPGKLGIDKRDYTFGPYAAFFYTISMKEGLGRYTAVREAVDNAFENGTEMPVILKKGCTEMEHKLHGGKRSDEWHEATPEDAEKEMFLDDIIERTEDQAIQPEWLKNLIALSWLGAAHAIGDPSYYRVVERFGVGDLFGDPPRTYHHLAQSQKKRDVVGKEVSTPRKTKVSNIQNAKKKRRK